MKKIIIFCNAPFAVQKTLCLYEKHRGRAEISIFVLQVEGIYKFLRSLNLEVAQLEFLQNLPHPVRWRHPLASFGDYFYLWRVRRQYFSNVYSATVFYPGDFHDPVLHHIIAYLSVENVCIDADPPTPGFRRYSEYTLKQKLYLRYLEQVLGTKLYYASLCSSEMYSQCTYFDREVYGIGRTTIELNVNVIKKYSVRYKPSKSRKTFLFLEGNLGHRYNHYAESMQQLLNSLDEAGFDVYIKPHPRIGCSSFLREMKNLRFIPDYVPAQFLRDEDFHAVGSLISTSLIDFVLRRTSVYCFELLFEQKNGKDRSYALDLITKESRLVASGRQSLMPETFKELQEMLRQP